MATTEKISLSLDTGAVLLARRAAEIDGLSLSASRLVRWHAWESERPRLTAEQQAAPTSRPQPRTSGRKHSTRSTGDGVRPGELWRSPSSVRDRVVLLVSSQTLLDQGITMLYAVEADADDPGPILLTIPVLVADEQCWLNIQRGFTRSTVATSPSPTAWPHRLSWSN